VADLRATDNLSNDYEVNWIGDGETYATEQDFLSGVDLSVWDMATQCASCHIGGGLVEFDRTGTRLSMRGLVRAMGMVTPPPGIGSYNAYDNYVEEKFNSATGANESYVAQSPWGMPATTDFKPLRPDHSNAVMAPQAWFQEGNPWVTAGYAVAGQAMMPNVREMDCLFCHMEGYNNIVSSVATQMGYLMASPALGSGLMNMFTMAYQPNMVELGTGVPMQSGMAYPAKLSGSAVARLKAEPPAANCRQCHIPTTMANFSDMFDKFLAAAPMSYNPASPNASAINGLMMPSYDLNSPFVPQGNTSLEVYMSPMTSSWWFYNSPTSGEPANGPFGIFPMALNMGIDVMATAMAGQPVGGGNPGMMGPLFYDGMDQQGNMDQNALKKATIPFPRADFFKRGDNWDGVQDDVHYGIGCAGCHFNTNIANPDLVQCDPGRGFSTMGGIENGKAGIDTRSTVKRCQDCHLTGTNFEGAAINTFNAPNPTEAHTRAGLLNTDVQAVRLNGAGAEEAFQGNHLDVIACQTCHVKKASMSVRALDSTSGNRYPTIIGIQSQYGMLSMFTAPMGDQGPQFDPVEWKPLYGWDEREQKTKNGSVNPDWRREIIPINMITAALWDDSGNPEVDANGDGAEGSGIPIAWDPAIQRNMKAGMNFAPGPFATIPVGFGGGAYRSAYDGQFNFTGAFDYVGIYGGNIILTNANEIAAYKATRGADWAGTKLTYFGGNPFQIEHGVAPVAAKALGMGGCTDCHAAGSGFFSGDYDMTGTAIPASALFDYGDGNGPQPYNMMQRPAVDIEITGYPGDLRTGSEAKAKLHNGQVLDVKFEEQGNWDSLTKSFTPAAGGNAIRTTDLNRSEYLYPHPEEETWADFYYAQPDLKGKTFTSLEERVAYLESINLESNHTAAPGSGPVVIFPDNGHDDAGWVGSKPYFDVTVDCTLCHATNLITIHGSNCATCHASPRITLDTWNGGCQQCHAVYHENSTKAHEPFEDPFDAGNDCSRCHSSSWSVPQSNCLNCHATNASGDTTPPVTTSNAQAEYYGPAKIDFSIRDNGKVAAGTTFYKLDGGTVTAGSYVLADTAGSHNLEFWSVDQAGNIESPANIASFEVVLDTTSPTTTSNAQAAYNQGAVITLTATDDSSLGVKTTYFRLDDGPVQTGTSVTIPATNGIITYTLAFWSEDWAGNIESEKSVSFTVTSGTGTIRLVWGNSDTSGSPCGGDPGANAAWTIRKGSWSGPVVASGFDGCPNWTGVEDIAVQIGPTPYFVKVDWWNSYDEVDDQTVFVNVYVTTPDQVAIRSY
jgi:hypothetical protein